MLKEPIPRQGNFLYLAVALVFLLSAAALVDQFAGQWGKRLVPAATVVTLALGVWSIRGQGIWYRTGAGLVLGVAALSVVGQFLESSGLVFVHLLTMLVFFCMTIWRALKQVLFTGEIDTNKILGSICIYIMMGLIWALMYVMLAEFDPAAFKDQQAVPWFDALGHYIYFSFVSLTTLGYGDITPVAPFARFLVYMEAVAGQFYMTILVASLVGMRISKLVADGGRSHSETRCDIRLETID
jgi:hypothetical protein